MFGPRPGLYGIGLSAIPDVFTQGSRDAAGEACTQPLAGTRALTGEPETDEALRAELLTDPKEVFEHATSVKLAVDIVEQAASRSSKMTCFTMEISSWRPAFLVQTVGGL